MSIAARQRKLLQKKKEQQQALWDSNDGKEPSTKLQAPNGSKSMREARRASAPAGGTREKVDEIVSCPFCGEHMPQSKKAMHMVIHPNQIIPNLWLGGYENAKDRETLKNKIKITHVLNVAKELANYHPKDFKYFKIELMDREAQEMISSFDKAFVFMDEALSTKGGKLFVHCQEGKSRSVTFIAAWLMNRKKYSLSNALATITSKRRIAQPNKGFITQLNKYEKYLQDLRDKEDEAKLNE